jgi:mRNA-degrading endonuclease RelE of RelBE toxin-antitoxin system
MSYKVRVEKQVRDSIGLMGLEHRRAVKKALVELQTEKGDIASLTDALSGFYRLRVGTYRIIFWYRPGKVIECVYINRRALVYEVFEREVVEKLRG